MLLISMTHYENPGVFHSPGATRRDSGAARRQPQAVRQAGRQAGRHAGCEARSPTGMQEQLGYEARRYGGTAVHSVAGR